MEFGPGHAPILLGSEDHEEGAFRELFGGEAPLREGAFIVGEEVAVEVGIAGPKIEDLDPVRGVAIGIKVGAAVVGHELGEVEGSVGARGDEEKEGERGGARKESNRRHGI